MPKPKKPREAKPGELREIHILESLERLSKRPESRMDVQRMLDGLTPNTKTYCKHLVMSGPSSLLSAAKTLSLTVQEIEAALDEIEKGIDSLRA
jgi:hypothetical protein